MGPSEYIKATVHQILDFFFYLKFYYLNIYDKLFSLERRCIEIFNLKIFNYDMTIFNPEDVCPIVFLLFQNIYLLEVCIYFYFGSFLGFLNKKYSNLWSNL